MEKIEQWEEKAQTKPEETIRELGEYVNDPSVEDAKAREGALRLLSSLHARRGDTGSLSDLITSCRPFLSTVPKARAGKIVRTLLDDVASSGGPGTLAAICRDVAGWCLAEKRVFLRQRVEARLSGALVDSGDPAGALAVAEPLSRELRKLDDKSLLLEVQLAESRAHFAIRDLPKAKATLTSARTTANAIYCPPRVQSELDLQSGVILAAEGDFKTAYSYFFEAFETKHGLAEPAAAGSLKYMLLCKIMGGRAGDVQAVASAKSAAGYAAEQAVVAMLAVAESYSARSIHAFEACLKKYPSELKEDSVVDTHLSELYDDLLVQNLSRLIEPFSKVEIAHIASLIELPVPFVEQKLSQMILDKRLDGILDQGEGNLIIFDPHPTNELYDGAIETVQGLDDVVNSLFQRAACLS